MSASALLLNLHQSVRPEHTIGFLNIENALVSSGLYEQVSFMESALGANKRKIFHSLNRQSRKKFVIVLLSSKFTIRPRKIHKSCFHRTSGVLHVHGLQASLYDVIASVNAYGTRKNSMRGSLLFILVGEDLESHDAQLALEDSLQLRCVGSFHRDAYILTIPCAKDDEPVVLQALSELLSVKADVTLVQQSFPKSRLYGMRVELESDDKEERMATAALLAQGGKFPLGSERPNVIFEGAEYTVWYGTNRKRNRDDGIQPLTYTAERSSSLSVGRCKVFVPKSHKIGSVGSSFFARILLRVDDRLRLNSIFEDQAETFWESLSLQFKQLVPEDKIGFIFIHGYNVDFEQAAIQAAQIGYDLNLPGPVAFYSWPSQGTLAGYLADAASIEASERLMCDFILQFCARSGATRVALVAHSMGNRGALRAINRAIAESSLADQILVKSNLILAAPDVDRDVFRVMMEPLIAKFKRITIYMSDRDRALQLSGFLHEYPRAGLYPPVTIVENADTVHVGNVDLSLLGHGYLTGARELLYDIHALILKDIEAPKRMGLKEIYDGKSKFWTISA